MSDDRRTTPPHDEPARDSAHDLVGSLVSDLAPVRPVRVASAIVVAMLLQVIVVIAVAWLSGARMVGLERLRDPAFDALLLVLGLGAAASAVAMTRLAIPGRVVAPGWRLTVLALPLVLAVVIAWMSPWGGTWKGFVAVFSEGLGCTRHTIVVAAPAWMATLLYLRRLGPLDPLRVGLFSAFSALFTAALVVQMCCAECDSWHLAISHQLPILLAAWAGALLSPWILRLRSS